MTVTSPGVQSAATGVLLVWVLLLTVLLWRRCREPWHDDGRPVYKRLPNGRIQFSWGTAQALTKAQRQHHDLAGGHGPDDPNQQPASRGHRADHAAPEPAGATAVTPGVPTT